MSLFRRSLWGWVNYQFNAVDTNRRALFGPDRTCAEWILRNGGSVKFKGSDGYLTDYNRLPPEGTSLFVEEIDASNTSITHVGFDHFQGCRYISTVVLHKCNFLSDKAMGKLVPLNDSLKTLQITSCWNITSNGLLRLRKLKQLRQLYLYDLQSVRKKDATVAALKKSLPDCEVTFL